MNDKLVFNEHAYSTTTQRHQRLVKTLLGDLGIKLDLVIDSRQSLSEGALQDAIDGLRAQNTMLLEATTKPRTQKKKNVERLLAIKNNEKRIKQIERVLNVGSHAPTLS